MKKAICLLSAIILCTALAGCGQTADGRSGVVNQGKSVSDVLNEKMNGDPAQTGEARDQIPEQPEKPAETTPPEESQAKPTDRTPPEENRIIPVDELPPEYQTVDVDLTELNSTMVYSEVNNMMISPDNYLGKKVRMSGTFNYAAGENRYYFACLIADATACCAQGIEFVLKTERAFPEEYPKAGTPITVVGIFDVYYEGENRFCQLIDACMI